MYIGGLIIFRKNEGIMSILFRSRYGVGFLYLLLYLIFVVLLGGVFYLFLVGEGSFVVDGFFESFFLDFRLFGLEFIRFF